MLPEKLSCPECDDPKDVERRDFLRLAAATAATAAGGLLLPQTTAAPTPKSDAETAVKALYETFSDKQKKKICFDWDYKDKGAACSAPTSPTTGTSPNRPSQHFYTKQQRA